ncbi:MAG: hypothetical protein O2797_04590 [Bacteroidetes bacterium]|nr:hypothetical protein [Bacteroidota bacterium]
MFDRPSFEPRPQFGPQVGGSQFIPATRPNGIPPQFLPNYAGDGLGKGNGMGFQSERSLGSGSSMMASGARIPSECNELPQSSGDSGSKVTNPGPIWSGDGRRDVANPMMPVWPMAGHRPGLDSTPPPQVLPSQGDGQGQVDLSNELTMNVNPTVSIPVEDKRKLTRKAKVKQTKNKQSREKGDRAETWKLVSLVVIFLIWISTASTLLFLYMDRYLFP